MVELELIELINKIKSLNTELQDVEVKAAAQGCPKRLYDTISAFSNQDTGGIIIFGLNEEENFNVVGVYDANDLQKKVTEQCKQMIPIVRPVFTVAKIDGKKVVSAEISGIDISERPCYYGGAGRMKGSYIRCGDSDKRMSDYEIYSYEAFRKKYEDDIRVNAKADMNSIDMTIFNRYMDIIKSKNQNLSKLEDEEVNRLMNMVVASKPTLACTLLFSKYPQVFYPEYTVNAMVVMGYEIGDTDLDGARFIDNKRIEGTIKEMLDGTMAFLQKNMRISTIVRPDTGMRDDRSEYPILALREAVLNALIHRDYSVHTETIPIEVIMFKDRLEVRNPGGLYGRLTVDQLGKIRPDTRNPILARVMETLGYTENRYSGIPTIQREMKMARMEEAHFENRRSEFVVTFYNRFGDVTLGENKGNVTLVEFCKSPKTRQEIADFLGLTTINYVMKNFVNPLIDSGQLKMTNPEHPRSKIQKYYS